MPSNTKLITKMYYQEPFFPSEMTCLLSLLCSELPFLLYHPDPAVGFEYRLGLASLPL